jgi:hypothetical protein
MRCWSPCPVQCRPPWTVFSEDRTIVEAELQTRILKLSQDERVFLDNAPDEDLFPFLMDGALQVFGCVLPCVLVPIRCIYIGIYIYIYIQFAVAALAADPALDPMRFRLVPSKVKEEQFWRNYFYRVSLLRGQLEVEPLLFLPIDKV